MGRQRWVDQGRCPTGSDSETLQFTLTRRLRTVNQLSGGERVLSPRAHAKALGQRLTCVRTVMAAECWEHGRVWDGTKSETRLCRSLRNKSRVCVVL